jgi:hypothetical protein
MSKFTLGQKVAIGFNAEKADERVPNQANGKWPGNGNFQTKAHTGVVQEIVQKLDANGAPAVTYVVGSIDFQDGRGSTRRVREVPEEKLSAA